MPPASLDGKLVARMAPSESQQAALECVAAFARARRNDALAVQEHICRMCDIPAAAMQEALTNVKRQARVALHFHPDRPSTSGETVALRLSCPPVRNLNQFIEAQVHGDVLLRQDVDALFADPSFQGTETGGVLLELCERYQVELRWHHGFRLSLEDVPRDFRGPTMPSLAERVAQSGFVDASAIGAIVRDLHVNPGAWSDRGSFDDVLQELKLLWHVLVKYGAPVRG